MVDFKKSEFITTYSGANSSPLRWFVDQVDKNFRLYEAGMYAVEKTQGICIYCGDALYELKEGIPSFHSIQWDHLQPASRWGIKTKGNFIPLCIPCNNSKSDKTPSAYWEEKLRNGEKLHFNTLEEFESFVYDFQEPFRNTWPEFYDLTINYTDDMDDMQIFLDYFVQKDQNDNWLVQFKKNRTKFTTVGVNGDYWAKVYEIAGEGRSESTASSARSRLGALQENFARKFGSDKAIMDLSSRDFNNFCYSCLYQVRSLDSTSSFGFTKNALYDMALASERPDFMQIWEALPGAAKFLQIYNDSRNGQINNKK